MSERMVLDCGDQPCPRPIIELAKAFTGVPTGGEIAVIARDPAARFDVPAWCRMRGQEYVGEEVTASGDPLYVVRRLS
ncbi:sulfurtransferase TusA family protein [Nocardioides montaniterrae]